MNKTLTSVLRSSHASMEFVLTRMDLSTVIVNQALQAISVTLTLMSVFPNLARMAPYAKILYQLTNVSVSQDILVKTVRSTLMSANLTPV